ncbi:major facilitator superfamily domain-containing protein [Desarmillaria ectypa]|nr:major facilitator superfamily domain-containing protein [Desarmillaria ectypa]
MIHGVRLVKASGLVPIFYLGYLVFEFPQNLCLQRLPVGKWLSELVVREDIHSLIMYATCRNFAGLFVVRLILGICEGSITVGFMIVTPMFYTRTGQTLRVGYWFLMNVSAQIISGSISFGTLHMKTDSLKAWKRLMIILGILTMMTAVIFWFLFPEERSSPVQRIKDIRYGYLLTVIMTPFSRQGNQTSVENKHFKKEQMIEALTDVKIWLFAIFSVLANIPNSLVNQRQIIISSFVFSYPDTILLGCVPGAVEFLAVWSCTAIAARIPIRRAWVGILGSPPSVCLSSLLTTGIKTVAVLSLSWLSGTTAGHTKRMATNTIVLSAYCIGNAVGPLMRASLGACSYRLIIIWGGGGVVFRILTLLGIRHLLPAENRRRDAEPIDTAYDDMYMERLKEDSAMEKARFDKEFLDLTDKQNRDFRRPLIGGFGTVYVPKRIRQHMKRMFVGCIRCPQIIIKRKEKNTFTSKSTTLLPSSTTVFTELHCLLCIFDRVHSNYDKEMMQMSVTRHMPVGYPPGP